MEDSSNWFNGVDQVVADPLHFKKMLSIGEDAYIVLRYKNKAKDAWDILGFAGSSAAVANSTTVATLLFAPKGWLALIGIGAASTPIGWVIAAGVVGGATWWGATQYLRKSNPFKVDVIPEFINTPLDALALGIFDLFAALSLQVAQYDGNISEAERSLIRRHFIDDWGYDENFVREGMAFTEERLTQGCSLEVNQLAESMAKLAAHNPDCNYGPITDNVIDFLKLLVDADIEGNQEKMSAINEIEMVFKSGNQDKKFGNTVRGFWRKGAIIIAGAKRNLSEKAKILKRNNTTQ